MAEGWRRFLRSQLGPVHEWPATVRVALPVLGAVPDGVMILFSGLGEDAQNEARTALRAGSCKAAK